MFVCFFNILSLPLDLETGVHAQRVVLIADREAAHEAVLNHQRKTPDRDLDPVASKFVFMIMTWKIFVFSLKII